MYQFPLLTLVVNGSMNSHLEEEALAETLPVLLLIRINWSDSVAELAGLLFVARNLEG